MDASPRCRCPKKVLPQTCPTPRGPALLAPAFEEQATLCELARAVMKETEALRAAWGALWVRLGVLLWVYIWGGNGLGGTCAPEGWFNQRGELVLQRRI